MQTMNWSMLLTLSLGLSFYFTSMAFFQQLDSFRLSTLKGHLQQTDPSAWSKHCGERVLEFQKT